MPLQSTPLVSIITPTFNRAATLPDAIRSVVRQSVKDFEYIIIDDGSTDDTLAVVRPFLKDKRIRFMRQKNAGPARAINRAARRARGTYICFLDADDEYRSDHLAASLQVFKRDPSLDFVVGTSRIIVPDRRQTYYVNDFFHPGRRISLDAIEVNTGVLVGKRSKFLAVGGFPTTTPYYDTAFYANLGNNNLRWTRQTKPTYVYHFGRCDGRRGCEPSVSQKLAR